MSDHCLNCGADSGTVGIIAGVLCSMCLEREGITVDQKIRTINDLPMNAICGNCDRPREAHLPRADWQCPSHGLYFNQPTPLIRRIAEAADYTGLRGQMHMSDLSGLVEHVRRLALQSVVRPR